MTTEAQRLADQLENNIGSVLPAEAAAELRRLDKLCAEWETKAATWLASPEAAQRLEGYRELAQQVNRLEAECEQLRKALQEIAWMRKPGVRVSRLVIAMEAAAVMALGKETK